MQKLVPPSTTYTSTGRFTGGTGQFEGAEGAITAVDAYAPQYDENGQQVFPIPSTVHIIGVVTYRM